MRELKFFLQNYGSIGVLRILVSPITTIFTTPYRLIQTLSHCSVVFEGKKLNEYPAFHLRKAFVALFYWTRALNLYRFGRKGSSPYLGLGDKSLSRFFFYSLPSLYAYWIGGVGTVLLGMFGWTFTTLIWLQDIHNYWVFLIIIIAVISTTFYVNTFYHQNYNASGWVFFPLVIYGLMTHHWTILGLAILFASFASITVVFISDILVLVTVLATGSLMPLLVVLPGNIKFILNLYPLVLSNHFFRDLLSVIKAVGISSKNIKYKRKGTKTFGIYQFYYLFIYLQFVICYVLLQDRTPFLFISAIAMFMVNAILLRFADFQSMQMLMLSLSTALVITSSNVFLLPSYWIAISPIPLLAFGFKKENFLDIVPELHPVSLKPYIQDMDDFLSDIKPGAKILMAFNDPNGVYENIFDGYRIIYELPLYVANKREIHLIPDWWAVNELNYEGAPDFWGRDVASVVKNMEYWQTDFVIIYQGIGRSISEEWEMHGFQVVRRFSWEKYERELQDYNVINNEIPEWILLQR